MYAHWNDENGTPNGTSGWIVYANNETRKVFAVSDGTGVTVDQVVRSVLVQFPHATVEVERFPGVRSKEQVQQIIRDASMARAIVVYTIVSERLRDTILDIGRMHHVTTIDVMGHLLARFGNELGTTPAETPGVFRRLNEGYFLRMEALEFAFRHDDGQRSEELSEAEIVLVGVSRTFKTPCSVYLAFQHWKAANVPIVLNVPLPSVLFELPPGTVFGLTTNPRHLTVLRHSRHEHLRGTLGEYVDHESVRLELMYSRRLCEQDGGWPLIDVTNKPVEEIASEILAIKRRISPTSVPSLL